MKKTKLLTSIAALALVVGLGACEVNVDVGGVDMGGVDVGVDVNPNDSSEDNTGENTSGDVCEHEWGEWVETKPATCTETGLETRTCTLCGETETRTIDALGHDWVETSNTATCTEAGVLTETCSRCGTTQTTDSDALGHDPQGAYSLDDENPELYHTQKCARCNEDIQEAHILGDTYTSAGDYYHTQTCEICGLSVQSAHNFGDTYVDSGDGQHCYEVCDDCGFQQQHNHTVGLEHLGEYESDGTYHWQTCIYCGAKYNTGVCDSVSIGYDDDQHWTACSVCGGVTGEKTDHDYKDIVADARGHSMSCECGKTVDFEAHTFEGDESITPLDDGYHHSSGACTKCGYEELGVHQVATSTDTTCSICGATDLNTEGLTYTVDASGNATATYTGSGTESDDAALFIPAAYVDGSNTYPVVSIGFDSSAESTSTIAKAQLYYKYIGLPEGLQEIGNYSLARAQYNSVSKLEEVNIPSTVTSIGTRAFQYNNALATIDFAEGDEGSKLASIGQNAFYYCEALTSLDLPSSVATLGTNVFQYCTGLQRIDLGDSITAISNYAFSNCKALTEVTYPETVTSFGSSTFASCTNLTSIVVRKSITDLGYQSFSGSGLNTIYYEGTEEEWSPLASNANSNDSFLGLTYSVLYYSEEEATGCWCYVDGVPTAW